MLVLVADEKGLFLLTFPPDVRALTVPQPLHQAGRPSAPTFHLC